MKSSAFGTQPLSPEARRTIIAGCIGFAVDFFDIYLPVLAMLPVIDYFEPKGLSPAASTTIYFFTFAATLLGRPCGAVIFGHWADRIGRRRTTMISIAGFGTFTFLIACLPGYEAIGIWSLALLILLRFIDGVFMGASDFRFLQWSTVAASLTFVPTVVAVLHWHRLGIAGLWFGIVIWVSVRAAISAAWFRGESWMARAA